jgi:hypothetical protein
LDGRAKLSFADNQKLFVKLNFATKSLRHKENDDKGVDEMLLFLDP